MKDFLGVTAVVLLILGGTFGIVWTFHTSWDNREAYTSEYSMLSRWSDENADVAALVRRAMSDYRVTRGEFDEIEKARARIGLWDSLHKAKAGKRPVP